MAAQARIPDSPAKLHPLAVGNRLPDESGGEVRPGLVQRESEIRDPGRASTITGDEGMKGEREGEREKERKERWSDGGMEEGTPLYHNVIIVGRMMDGGTIRARYNSTAMPAMNEPREESRKESQA